jgi:hypothetical protein
MDPLLAWRQWSTSLAGGDGLAAAGTGVRPWSVLRFLTTRRKRRLEDYTEVDLREFLARAAATPYERRYYERAVRSFFAWCRQLAGHTNARRSAPPFDHPTGLWPRLRPLARLVVLMAYLISAEAALALMIVQLAR